MVGGSILNQIGSQQLNGDLNNLTGVRVMIKSIVAYLNYSHMHACDSYGTKCI